VCALAYRALLVIRRRSHGRARVARIALTRGDALTYADSRMSFWEDLSASTKRYVIIAVVLVASLVAFRSCAGPETGAAPPPRGMAR
jgi:hypothetical protein